MPGPPPKRDAQRRRTNKPAIPTTTVVIAAGPPSPPPLRPGLHALATAWYESLVDSGQSRFYEPSDWMAAQLLAEAIDAWTVRRSASMLISISAGMSSLLVCEADRRRVRLELERTSAVDHDAHRASATVTELRARLMAPPTDGSGGPAA